MPSAVTYEFKLCAIEIIVPTFTLSLSLAATPLINERLIIK